MGSGGLGELINRAWARSEQVRKSQARGRVNCSRPPDGNSHLDDLDVWGKALCSRRVLARRQASLRGRFRGGHEVCVDVPMMQRTWVKGASALFTVVLCARRRNSARMVRLLDRRCGTRMLTRRAE